MSWYHNCQYNTKYGDHYHSFCFNNAAHTSSTKTGLIPNRYTWFFHVKIFQYSRQQGFASLIKQMIWVAALGILIALFAGEYGFYGILFVIGYLGIMGAFFYLSSHYKWPEWLNDTLMVIFLGGILGAIAYLFLK